jgi:hypothetical protein
MFSTAGTEFAKQAALNMSALATTTQFVRNKAKRRRTKSKLFTYSIK